MVVLGAISTELISFERNILNGFPVYLDMLCEHILMSLPEANGPWLMIDGRGESMVSVVSTAIRIPVSNENVARRRLVVGTKYNVVLRGRAVHGKDILPGRGQDLAGPAAHGCVTESGVGDHNCMDCMYMFGHKCVLRC